MAPSIINPDPGNPQEYGDFPLNYYDDQLPDIRPQLRKLDLKLVYHKTVDNLSLISSALLLGGSLAFLARKKFPTASFLFAGFILQQVFNRIGGGNDLHKRDMNDREIERYALKAQKGDYGKLEVIPFK